MVPTGSLLAFAVAAFALIVVPGPSLLFVISQGVALAGRACRSPRRLEVLGGMGGVVMIGLGVRPALVGRRD